jgi:hypothetical protein
MAEILFGMLNADFDMEISGNTYTYIYEIPRRGKLSVRCLTHILNLIVKEFLGTNNFYIPTVGIISTDIFMRSMDFMNMNISNLSMGSPSAV